MSNIEQIETILHTAYDMLGDGDGSEWYDNPEYTRAVVEFVGELIPLSPEMVDRGGDGFEPFVLGMIYAGHVLGSREA